MELAPIVLFVYHRLEHSKRTIEALVDNSLAQESVLIVFSDGPQNDEDIIKVNAVRQYVHGIRGFKFVNVIESKVNKGLAESVIAGVSKVVNEYGRVIVLEDDMVTSPYFLQYMNDALNLYQDEEKVISIHGYCYPVDIELPETFFLKGADCWGWATWKRGWDLFEPDGKKLLEELKRRQMTHEFDFNGAFPFTKMLKDQIAGKVDSWAIRWRASAFINDKFTLFPGKIMVENIGIDGTGRHCSEENFYKTSVSQVMISNFPVSISESSEVAQGMHDFFKKNKKSIFQRFIEKLKLLYKHIWRLQE